MDESVITPSAPLLAADLEMYQDGSAWLTALDNRRREWRLEFLREAQVIVFASEEAERVAATPDMQRYATKLRQLHPGLRLLPCGLPESIRGLRVVISSDLQETENPRHG